MPRRGTVEWKIGSAEALPVADGSFEGVLLSLVPHQLRNPERAFVEVFRALVPGGRVVVRTIAPEDVAGRVPARFFPAIAVADMNGWRHSMRSKVG
ncbi:MAG: methyltransferase domain-containing protein [Alphaproteobacteria bacterium]|nr:methyltransferase domain-containing protein [Alphaproteobacteria bacterium]